MAGGPRRGKRSTGARGGRNAGAAAGLLLLALLAAAALLLLRGSDPFEGATLHVAPNSNAGRQAEEWRSSRPEDAALMGELAGLPLAYWFDAGSGDVRAAVDRRVTEADEAGALPVLVAYNVPNRDCSGQSTGGASSEEEYGRWIRDFAAGIGDRDAVVVLEPDALALLDCLSKRDRAARLAVLKDAVGVLESEGNTAVYLDAGHSDWVAASEMANRLRGAGLEDAEGFALNVSNYQRTSDNLDYGEDLSSRVGGKHFVVDTSRNGRGPAPGGEWCNPPERALGEAPTSETAGLLADAYLWIKVPGESDG
ncbi:MAG: glycoside hydrolase family 6 protein, partial [Actinomycetota bacterium]|nr:glycoside hydrolase family 6 protein [Actinomycetota bacterium]